MPAELPVLGEAAALVAYRVVQEGLTNVVRHSGARHCRIRIELAENALQVSVEDDGKGLSEAGPARRGGLLGMAERLDMAGGSLNIENNASVGLHLQARLPLNNEKTQEEQR